MKTVRLDMSHIAAVALDFYGTLANTFAAHQQARQQAFQQNSLDDIPPEFHAHGPLFGSTTQLQSDFEECPPDYVVRSLHDIHLSYGEEIPAPREVVLS
ncbi:MAG TPA: hypothetical protein VK978_03790 [Candidatus Saccharimonadales bacterium]|nr:hypothetical protein [Candidatus Saccharimonadales bacterium]